MIALLLAIASPVLTLEQGQSLEFQARLDCETGNEEWNLNGAVSASRLNTGMKRVTFLFIKKEEAKAEGSDVLLIETFQSGRTYMDRVSSNSVPSLSDIPQAPLSFARGETNFFMVTSRFGPKNADWDYSETQVGVHGDTIKYKGACKLSSEVAE